MESEVLSIVLSEWSNIESDVAKLIIVVGPLTDSRAVLALRPADT